MSQENQNTKRTQLITELITETHDAVDVGNLKSFVLDTYSDAQMSPLFGTTPEQRYENFYYFKQLYNMLLKLEMYFSADITGVNTLE